MTRAWTSMLLVLALGCGRSDDTPDDAGPDSGPDAATPLRLTFEPIALDGEAIALTNVVHVPGTDTELLLLEKSGEIHHYAVNGASATRLGGVQVPGVDTSGDCGLVSVVFDPDYAANHYLFVGACISPTHSSITRYVFDPADLDAFASSGVEIITVGDALSPDPWHSVGSMGFEPDGVLWALFGEKNLPDEAQDVSNALGSLVRLVPSRTPGVGGYVAAPDNPFALDDDPGTNDVVAAYGLRSPWKGTRDARGNLFIGDVGASLFEEVNVLPAVRVGTPSFGWPAIEGPCDGPCEDGHLPPLVAWSREADDPLVREDPEAAPTARRVAWVGTTYAPDGNDRYEGALTGRLLYGDFCVGFVRALELGDDGALVSDAFVGHLQAITGMAQAGDGYLYVSSYGNCYTHPTVAGALHRVTLAP